MTAPTPAADGPNELRGMLNRAIRYSDLSDGPDEMRVNIIDAVIAAVTQGKELDISVLDSNNSHLDSRIQQNTHSLNIGYIRAINDVLAILQAAKGDQA